MVFQILHQFLIILFVLFCIKKSFQIETYSDLKIYIYDTAIWPNVSQSSMQKRDPNEILENTLNFGAGPAINISRGSYHTDQYQLFLLFYNRILKDPRRTYDPNEATIFFIPYDFASDSAYYKSCAKSAGTCFDFRKCPLAPDVENLLLASPWFKRNQGRDHVLIVGMNYMMDHYILKPKCKSLISGTCMNCTKFAIDDYSFMYAREDRTGIETRGDNWHAIPFPADFHWTRFVKRPFPWENEDRPILASYVGSDRSYYGPARRLRGSIIHYCEKHPEDCVHQSYGAAGTRSSFKVEGYDPLLVSMRSVFCFQPIGDLMTRKGLFDSLLQGCIPVVFDDLTASVMYTWHWEEKFWREVSISYPFHPTAFRYFDPIEDLNRQFLNNSQEIQRKLRLIRSRVFELQYSLESWYDVEASHHPSHSRHTHLTNTLSPPSPSSQLLPPSVLSLSTWPLVDDDDDDNNDQDSRSSILNVISKNESNQPQSNQSQSNQYNQSIQQSKDKSKLKPQSKPKRHMRDAYDIAIDWALGWHSGREKHVRNASVPECWNDAIVDPIERRCVPNPEKIKEKEKEQGKGKLRRERLR